MDAFFDLVGVAIGVAVMGVRRAFRDPPANHHPVVRTPWLAAAGAALVAELVVTGVAMGAFAWIAWGLFHDSILFFLGLVVFPLALTGLALVVAAMGWAVPVVRRLYDADGGVRGDLVVAGLAAGALAVLAGLVRLRYGLALAFPAGVILTAAATPAAWRPDAPAHSII